MRPQYVTVSRVNQYIKRKLTKDKDLRNIFVKGEISNFKVYPSGHCYFTLKDERSQISGVMFRNFAKSLKFKPKDGMKVLIEGEINVYDVRGTYNLLAHKISQDGLGDLYVAFEQLKKKLRNEGLFDDSYKKPIPKFPKRIGVVTAPTGAAIKDIITTIKRRWPLCEVILFPSLVQGELAAPNIVRQIKNSEKYELDTLIVGRGGGSIEDLWAFNEEIVARAIFECNVPVISAVGHEVDYTISDFVADLRAPTPTAAAELAVPKFSEIQNNLNDLDRRSNQAIKLKLSQYNLRFKNIINKNIFKNPDLIYRNEQLKLDELVLKLNFESKNLVSTNKNKLSEIKNSFIFKNPKMIMDKKSNQLLNNINKLEVLNPLNTVKRGYTLAKVDGKVVSSSKTLKKGDKLEVEFKDGSVNTEVI
ncbi:MAG: exodeoxyribonuclease VII large subunit [archaeon]|nr:exodeoxyribonuclease VII large subunit [archaeon]